MERAAANPNSVQFGLFEVDLQARELRKAGVKIKLNQVVSRVTADGLHLKDGEIIPCDLKVWASGITGQPIVHSLRALLLPRTPYRNDGRAQGDSPPPIHSKH